MSKPVTRSASKTKGKTTVHEVDAGSPRPKNQHIRRRKSAPAATENNVDDGDDLKDLKGKAKAKPTDQAERVLGLKLEGLKGKLGEESEDLTVKLHPTVRTCATPFLAHTDDKRLQILGRWPLQVVG